MELLDVYQGFREWSDYARNRPRIEEFDASLKGHAEDPLSGRRPRSLSVSLATRDYATALQSGLGALGSELGGVSDDEPCRLELGIEKMAGGIGKLQADFNLLLGDAIWKVEMPQATLADMLDEIRLAEFEREARAYRSRAERAYLNGWHEEALDDFLEAAKRNYPDFSVHRSIATIYLYHLIDLDKAEEYYCKAARYARPSDPRESAEAHYFAGVVCALRRRPQSALTHLAEAVKLNPALSEAHYQRACLAALVGDKDAVTESLESAIEGDPRYHERARNDRVFEGMRPIVEAVLDNLMKPVQERLAEARQRLKPVRGYVTVRSEEQLLAGQLRDLESRLSEANTYKGGLEFLKSLSRFQEQLRDLYDRFHKQYQIDLNDYVRSVAFSPDGRFLASGFLNGGISVFQVHTGQKIASLEGHEVSVNSVAFSPNGRTLASGSRDKTIKLWDVDSAGEIQTLRGHEAEVRAVAFSPDGRLLASSSLDKTVKLWDVTTGRAIRTLQGHTQGVESLAFSPDGKLLASGGDDRQIRIWDIYGRELQTLAGLSNDVTSIAFSPDGKLLAAGSLGRTIRLWRVAAGELIKTVRFTEISYNSVAFSPEGQWLALGSRDIQLWLKVVLTEEGYAAMKAAEQFSILTNREAPDGTKERSSRTV